MYSVELAGSYTCQKMETSSPANSVGGLEDCQIP
jgi:hypothetical protein